MTSRRIAKVGDFYRCKVSDRIVEITEKDKNSALTYWVKDVLTGKPGVFYLADLAPVSPLEVLAWMAQEDPPDL